MNLAKKRLAVFLDGTWNDPTDNTNVWRLKTLVAPRGEDGVEQLAYYDAGVGTGRFEKLRGGIGGYGLSRNIREAYRWLIEHHNEGDEIFIFGFSRGAFTARSLAGLIATSGLPETGSPLRISDLYRRYRDQRKPLHQLEFENSERVSEEEAWLRRYSKKVEIDFVGVWETVGTLGIPFGNIPGISRRKFRFHRMRPSQMYKRGVQALALDEHRKAYDAGLWTNYVPLDNDGKIVEERLAENCYPDFEQRWFIGAHCNVGGGYRWDLCAQVPLQWMQQKAKAAGLAFSRDLELTGVEHLEGKPVDSFKRMMKGLYRIVRLGRRHYRTVQRPMRDYKGKARIETINETIDHTVFDRWRSDESYRPKNLIEWSRRTGIDPATVTADTGLAEAMAHRDRRESPREPERAPVGLP
jgi:uncharacterized protein (DUF2235 family)